MLHMVSYGWMFVICSECLYFILPCACLSINLSKAWCEFKSCYGNDIWEKTSRFYLRNSQIVKITLSSYKFYSNNSNLLKSDISRNHICRLWKNIMFLNRLQICHPGETLLDGKFIKILKKIQTITMNKFKDLFIALPHSVPDCTFLFHFGQSLI